MNAWQRCSLFLLILVPCLVVAGGCKGGKQMVHVRGKVTYKDGSIPKASLAIVRFTPAENTTAEVKKGATGPIDAEGNFEMYTMKPGDGVYVGDYVVTFLLLKDAMNQNSSVIAQKYTTPMSPPYKITVDGNKDDLHYEIEPAGAAGAEPAGKAAAGPGA